MTRPRVVAIVVSTGAWLTCATGLAGVLTQASASTAENGTMGDSEFSATSAGASIGQGDDAGSLGFGLANGSLAGGFANASSHGCAAPNPVKSTGSGSGAGRTTIEDFITITSSTLPVGTPVDVSFDYAIAASVHAIIRTGDSLGDGAGAGVQATVYISGPGGRLAGFDGSVARTGNQAEGIGEFIQGPWDGASHSAQHDLSGVFAVGDTIYLYAFLLATSGASADWGKIGDEVFASVTDGDSQGSISWGLNVYLPGGGSGDISLVSLGTDQAPPGTQNGSIDTAQLYLPPRPPGTIPVPEPSALSIMLLGLASISCFRIQRIIRRAASL